MFTHTSHTTTLPANFTQKALIVAMGLALTTTMSQKAQAEPTANELPTGAHVVSGNASIQQSGNQMTINQSTDKAIINWNTFNIGRDATTTFNQPGAGSVALNRVQSSDPSAIYGTLQANGQVFLINPNGVIFGQGAHVDVGGMVASTLDINNDDFLAGNYRFERNGATGSITNQGELIGQYIAMLAPEVQNQGVMIASMGTVALAAGDAVTLTIAGQNNIDVVVEQATIDTLINNKHLIQVDEGTVIISAQSANDLLGQVVNSGQIEANGVVNDGGLIRLRASSSIDHSGSLSADAANNGKGGDITLIANLDNPNSQTTVSGSISAKGGSTSGDGGFIETSASHLHIEDSAEISTKATNGTTGQWLLDPYDFTIAASGGDITGAALTSALNSTSITIETTDTAATCDNGVTCGSGTSTGNGDIFVNDIVTISSTASSTLTLRAWRNIEFNADMSIEAGATLALEYAQGGTGGYKIASDVTIDDSGMSGSVLDDGSPVIPSTEWDPLPYTSAGFVSSGTTNAYVILTNSTLTSVYGDSPTLTYAFYDAATGGNLLSLSPTVGTVDWLAGYGADSIDASLAAGSYDLAYNGGFTLSGYSFQPVTAVSWIITPRPVTVTVSKTYDGTADFSSGYTLSNLLSGHESYITLSGTASTNSADAGSYSTFVTNNLSLNNSSYTLTGGTYNITVTPRVVNVSASKTYDGSASFDSGFTLANVVSGDSVSAAGSATVSDSAAGTYTAFVNNNLALNNANYTLTGGNHSLVIKAAQQTSTTEQTTSPEQETVVQNSVTASLNTAAPENGEESSQQQTGSGSTESSGASTGGSETATGSRYVDYHSDAVFYYMAAGFYRDQAEGVFSNNPDWANDLAARQGAWFREVIQKSGSNLLLELVQMLVNTQAEGKGTDTEAGQQGNSRSQGSTADQNNSVFNQEVYDKAKQEFTNAVEEIRLIAPEQSRDEAEKRASEAQNTVWVLKSLNAAVQSFEQRDVSNQASTSNNSENASESRDKKNSQPIGSTANQNTDDETASQGTKKVSSDSSEQPGQSSDSASTDQGSQGDNTSSSTQSSGEERSQDATAENAGQNIAGQASEVFTQEAYDKAKQELTQVESEVRQLMEEADPAKNKELDNALTKHKIAKEKVTTLEKLQKKSAIDQVQGDKQPENITGEGYSFPTNKGRDYYLNAKNIINMELQKLLSESNRLVLSGAPKAEVKKSDEKAQKVLKKGMDLVKAWYKSGTMNAKEVQSYQNNGKRQ